MGMIDRHKKRGGFKKLVNSLETTHPEKRAKIIAMLKEEDPILMEKVEQSIFDFSEFETMSDLLVCEILSQFKEFKTLAIALYKCPNEALIAKFLKQMAPAQRREYNEQVETLRGVTVSEQNAARFRIVESSRALEKSGKFTLKRYLTDEPLE